MTVTDTLLVYVTVPDEETAVRIGRAVVEEHLAACVNVVPAIRSLYWWEGSLQEDAESLMLIKTTQQAFEALRQRIVQLHPYSVPCITALSIQDGHPPYLEWVRSETQTG